jgi:drug/metabolite transporter (DMT)-like permease
MPFRHYADPARSVNISHAPWLTCAMATATAVRDAQGQRRGRAYVALAAVAWSSAGVLQRGLDAGAATQVAGRAVFAAIAILAYIAVVERGRVLEACRSVGLAGLGFAVAMAAASGAFIVALNHTTVAHVLFIQASAPVLAALLARVALGEPVSRRSAAAMAVALAGVGIMVAAGGGGGRLIGDGLAFVMALAFAVAIVITRHRRDVSMAPATFFAQLILLAAFLPFARLGDIGGGDLPELVFLGAGQIGLGLVLLTIGAPLIPAAQVALISLLEVVLGPLWVWLALGERPSGATVAGGAVVVVAVVIQASGRRPDGIPEPVDDAAVRSLR